ncbi:BREX-4 system phosphatase PglZ [Candidatus Methanarcanum hacksteinii]|uniref:BREX-4 system phosphatase PglZ n=1 Tax=Candidatus Methanarcanum hacksteinii TaxID=2911857 RepID=UPI0037DBFB26
MSRYIENYFGIHNNNHTRIEVVPNRSKENEVLSHYLSIGVKIVPIWDLMPSNSTSLVMPDVLMDAIKKYLEEHDEQIVIKGLSEYFLLIDGERINKTINALKEQIEMQKMKCIFLIHSDFSNITKFNNPKYSNSLQYVELSGIHETLYSPTIIVLPSEYVQGPGHLSCYNQLLKKMYDDNGCQEYGESRDYRLSIPQEEFHQKGVNGNIVYVDEPEKIAKIEFGFEMKLPEDLLIMLLNKCHEEKKTIGEILSKKIDVDNIPLANILKELIDHTNDPLWDAMVWFVKQKIDKNTFLHYVIEQGITKENVLHQYIVDCSLDVLDDIDIKSISDERSNSLKHITSNISPMIKEFISRSKDKENAIFMLNNGFEDEKIELVRRLRGYDLFSGIPSEYASYFPELNYYVASFDYGTEELTQYFKEYRIYKLKNTVTSDFAKKALEMKVPNNISSRDEEIAKYRNEKNSCLLVVDGMGAEYLPYLLQIFRMMNYNIEKSAVVSVKLPTSTEFNSINWNNERIQEIKNVDNIAHNGVVKNETNVPEQNIVNILLNTFNRDLLGRIASNIANYSKIIVTSDHGTSRLAVIANEMGLSKRLPFEHEPKDWRFTVEVEGEPMPEGMEKRYDPDRDETYWVVRGYNRLPKQGGKKNELHGGASLEERLVPFIVISGKGSSQTKKINAPQIKEKDDFDI